MFPVNSVTYLPGCTGEEMKRIAATFVFALICIPAPSFGGPIIVDILFPTEVATSSGWGGFWFGTTTGPEGVSNYVVAQTFTLNRDYIDVTAAVSLSSGSGATPATFVFALDDNGRPGALVTNPIDLIVEGRLKDYLLAFENVGLTSGQTYWLLASSSSVVTLTEGAPHQGSHPAWAVSNGPGGQLAESLNGGPWVFHNRSFSYALYGTGIGPEPAEPPFLPVPEPSSSSMLLLGAAALTALRRRQRTV